MNPWVRCGAMLAVGWACLILTSCLAIWVPFHPFQPLVVIPIVIYVATASGLPLWQGALVCFGLGYLQDFFCGSPVGLHTLIMTALVIITRTVGLWIFSRSWLMQMLVCGVAALLSGILVLALTAIFEPSELSWSLSLPRWTSWLVASTLTTGVVAPLVVLLLEFVDQFLFSAEEKVL